MTSAGAACGKEAGRPLPILSAMLTWSFENAVETADSMRSRGYGLKGRTSFSIYRMSRRDWVLLCWMLFCAACLLWGWTAGCFPFAISPP